MRATGLCILVLTVIVGCGGGGGGGAVVVTTTTIDTLLVAFDLDGILYAVDLATGDAVPVLQTFVDKGGTFDEVGPVSAALYNPANGVMWLGMGGKADCDGCILDLDLSTGEATTVADNSALTRGLPDLTFDAAGNVYSFAGDDDTLLHIDPSTGVATEIGAPAASYNGYAMTFANGQVYFAGSTALYTIDTATAAETKIADFSLTGFPATTANDFDVLSMTTLPNGVVYALVRDDTNLRRQTHLAMVNLGTAELTHIGRTAAELNGLVYADLTFLVSLPPAAHLRHDYQLNNTFADALGGPSLVPNGGTLDATGYALDDGQGLSLSNGIHADEYSIEIRFSLNDLTWYQKLIDWSALTSEMGVYAYEGILCHYDNGYGPDGAFAAGRLAHMVVTRTRFNIVIVYVDGVIQTTFLDLDGLAVASMPGNMLYFMQDDMVSTDEDTAGLVDFIRIYDGVLTPAQVVALRDGGAPPR